MPGIRQKQIGITDRVKHLTVQNKRNV